MLLRLIDINDARDISGWVWRDEVEIEKERVVTDTVQVKKKIHYIGLSTFYILISVFTS